MKNFCCLIFCFVLLACNQSSHNKATNKPADAGPFDLAKLSLNENLPDMMAAEHIKAQPKDSTDDTMLGFEVFKTGDAKVLRFAGADVAGQKNLVVFHYNETGGQLVGYELTLSSQSQTDTLINRLSKTATIVFKRTKMPKGEIELDVNGNEVKPENSLRQTYRVWEDKTKGITYFLTEDGTEPSLTTKLIALKAATQFGKDWIAARQLDWYKNEKSE